MINALIALVSVLLGGGGYAAYVRAMGQNRSDLYQMAVDRITRLEARTDEQNLRNDMLAEQNAKLQSLIGTIEGERSSLDGRLVVQRTLIDDLNGRVSRLDVTEEENANLRQKLQIEIAKVEFLQREVDHLRREVARLLNEIKDLRNRQDHYAT
jgi:chromosome segregation ATPase